MSEYATKQYPSAVVLSNADWRPNGPYLSDEVVGSEYKRRTELRSVNFNDVITVFQPTRIDVVIGQAGLNLSVSGPIPAWLKPVFDRCQSILALRENWDGYGAPRIQPFLVASTVKLLNDAMRPNIPAPDLTPTAAGQLQIEWHCHGFDIEIRVVGPGRYDVFAADLEAGEETELTCTFDTSPIRRLLQALADRRATRSAASPR